MQIKTNDKQVFPMSHFQDQNGKDIIVEKEFTYHNDINQIITQNPNLNIKEICQKIKNRKNHGDLLIYHELASLQNQNLSEIHLIIEKIKDWRFYPNPSERKKSFSVSLNKNNNNLIMPPSKDNNNIIRQIKNPNISNDNINDIASQLEEMLNDQFFLKNDSDIVTFFHYLNASINYYNDQLTQQDYINKQDNIIPKLDAHLLQFFPDNVENFCQLAKKSKKLYKKNPNIEQDYNLCNQNLTTAMQIDNNLYNIKTQTDNIIRLTKEYKPLLNINEQSYFRIAFHGSSEAIAMFLVSLALLLILLFVNPAFLDSVKMTLVYCFAAVSSASFVFISYRAMQNIKKEQNNGKISNKILTKKNECIDGIISSFLKIHQDSSPIAKLSKEAFAQLLQNNPQHAEAFEFIKFLDTFNINQKQLSLTSIKIEHNNLDNNLNNTLIQALQQYKDIKRNCKDAKQMSQYTNKFSKLLLQISKLIQKPIEPQNITYHKTQMQKIEALCQEILTPSQLQPVEKQSQIRFDINNNNQQNHCNSGQSVEHNEISIDIKPFYTDNNAYSNMEMHPKFDTNPISQRGKIQMQKISDDKNIQL